MADLKEIFANLPGDVKEKLVAHVEEKVSEGVDPAEAVAAFAEKSGIKVAVAEVKKLINEINDENLDQVAGGLADSELLAGLARFKEGLIK